MLVFNDNNMAQWVHHIHAIALDAGIRCHSTRFYFDDTLCRIAQRVSPLSPSYLAIKRRSVKG